ncbi:MAG: hypothetical protein IPG02_02410 [Ignavibacteria bacterium]|nr:hypothetical protein [Ignavibacteria bacterium]
MRKSFEVKSRVINGKINRDRLLINELEFNDKNTLILSLTLEKNIDLTSNQVSYFLIAQYGGKEQFLIKEKDCIMISVDGENHMFSTTYEPWVDTSDLGDYLIVVYLDVEKITYTR